jgi:hypothetical protein
MTWQQRKDDATKDEGFFDLSSVPARLDAAM